MAAVSNPGGPTFNAMDALMKLGGPLGVKSKPASETEATVRQGSSKLPESKLLDSIVQDPYADGKGTEDAHVYSGASYEGVVQDPYGDGKNPVGQTEVKKPRVDKHAYGASSGAVDGKAQDPYGQAEVKKPKVDKHAYGASSGAVDGKAQDPYGQTEVKKPRVDIHAYGALSGAVDGKAQDPYGQTEVKKPKVDKHAYGASSGAVDGKAQDPYGQTEVKKPKVEHVYSEPTELGELQDPYGDIEGPQTALMKSLFEAPSIKVAQSIISGVPSFVKPQMGAAPRTEIKETKQAQSPVKTAGQELAKLTAHEGTPKKGNEVEAKIKGLEKYYNENPTVAKQDLEKAKSKLEQLAKRMNPQFSEDQVVLLGRDTLNRIVLTDDKFKEFLHDPDVVKGMLALKVLKAGDPSLSRLDEFAKGHKMTDVFMYGLQSHPSQLSVVPPNSVTRGNPEFLAHDQMRRQNISKLGEAVDKAFVDRVSQEPSGLQVKSSRWNAGYNPADWKGSLHGEFSAFCKDLKATSSKSFRDFVVTRPDLKDWLAQPSTGELSTGAKECRGGLMLLIKETTGGSSKDLTKDQLVEHLANSKAWQDPFVAHMCLDRLHFGAMMMFGEGVKLTLKDGSTISGADLMLAVADHIKAKGVSSENAIAAEALFARMAILKDHLKIS